MLSIRGVITMYSVTNDSGGNSNNIKPALTRDQTARISTKATRRAIYIYVSLGQFFFNIFPSA